MVADIVRFGIIHSQTESSCDRCQYMTERLPLLEMIWQRILFNVAYNFAYGIKNHSLQVCGNSLAMTVEHRE